MDTKQEGRRMRLLAVGLPLIILAAVALVIAVTAPGGGRRAQAATDPSVDFSLSSTGCDSSGTPTATCAVDASATFTVAFNLNSLPSNGSYDGYDAKINYTSGLTTAADGLHQTGAGNWSDCSIPFSDFLTNPGTVSFGCTIGIGAPSSTYVGSLAHLDFTCGSTPSTEMLTVVHGDNNTDVIDNILAAHSEAADESLTISCGGGGGTPTTPPSPTETPTPCVDCPTETPTNTPAPTATFTPTPAGVCGDANGDGEVNSLDAFFVLQYDAGLISTVPHPENADTNHDGYINSLDALIILQINAGLLSSC